MPTGSTNVQATPRLARKYEVATPVIPPPTTTMFLLASMLGGVRSAGTDHQAIRSTAVYCSRRRNPPRERAAQGPRNLTAVKSYASALKGRSIITPA
eukprot:scaffold36706_cov63-Phaeocystis_antarctica.AAC.2